MGKDKGYRYVKGLIYCRLKNGSKCNGAVCWEVNFLLVWWMNWRIVVNELVLVS